MCSSLQPISNLLGYWRKSSENQNNKQNLNTKSTLELSEENVLEKLKYVHCAISFSEVCIDCLIEVTSMFLCAIYQKSTVVKYIDDIDGRMMHFLFAATECCT